MAPLTFLDCLIMGDNRVVYHPSTSIHFYVFFGRV